MVAMALTVVALGGTVAAVTVAGIVVILLSDRTACDCADCTGPGWYFARMRSTPVGPKHLVYGGYKRRAVAA